LALTERCYHALHIANRTVKIVVYW